MSTDASQLDVQLALDAPEHSHTDDPHVTGRPLRWLQLEGLVLLIGSLLLFATTHQPWSEFAAPASSVDPAASSWWPPNCWRIADSN